MCSDVVASRHRRRVHEQRCRWVSWLGCTTGTSGKVSAVREATYLESLAVDIYTSATPLIGPIQGLLSTNLTTTLMLPPDMVGGFGQSRSSHLYPEASYRSHPLLDTVLASVWLD